MGTAGRFWRFRRRQGEQGKAATVSAEFTAPSATAPGRLFITATIKSGWHIYSITQPEGGPLATKITLKPPAGVRVGDFQVSPPPKKSKEVGFGDLVIESHAGTMNLVRPAGTGRGRRSRRAQDPGEIERPGLRSAGLLSAAGLRLHGRAGPGGGGRQRGGRKPAGCGIAAAAGQPESQPSGRRGRGLALAAIHHHRRAGQLTGAGLDLDKIQQDVHQQFAAASPLDIAWYVVAGFLGGLILNVMPCVLPVIGLKIMSFVEQSGHDRRRALVLNVWYSLGLLAVFFVLATLAVTIGLGWGQMFAKAGFSLTLAAVVFVMGLSFLGVWEIPIPGFAGRGKATELAAKEGAAGAFVKGALTTVLATPCTFPVLATALAWAIAQPPLLTYAVFLSIGLGMASPYLLIAVFPRLIRFLPKPGAWMDTFKQLMGFVLMGTVVWFLTFVDLPLVAPTVGLLFGLWGACWWVGRLSPLADGGAKGRTWLEAAAFAAVVWILMFTGISFPGVEPLGVPAFSFRGLAQVMRDRYDFEVRIAAIRGPVVHPAVTAGPKTVMVDFTANWCPNCKFLEATVLESPAVVEAVRRYGVVTLQADWSHEDPEVSKLLEALGCKQIPVLAIFPARDPNHPVVFLGGCWTQTLVDALKKAAGK